LIFSDSLSTSADDLLKAYTDILMNPAFNDIELRRAKAQMTASLQKKVDNPSSFASDEFEEAIFGPNAYGRDENGTIETLAKLNKQDVIRQYLTFFRPNNASLAVVGNYDEAFEEKVKQAFGKWTKRKTPSITQEKIPAISGVDVVFYAKKGLQQTQIRFGQLGIKRNDPDFLKLRVANEVLGGGFSSRLNQHVRDDLGLTYSIGSSYQSYAEAGVFSVSTFSKNETVGKTLDESLKVIQEFSDKGISAKELEAAKSLLVGQFPQAIETADKTAFNLLMLDFFGIPVSYLTDYNKTIESFSLSDINMTIRRHLEPKIMKIVIYGDPSVLPQLQAYKVERRDVK
jgi:zinc protease